jgi:hypothetical protein
LPLGLCIRFLRFAPRPLRFAAQLSIRTFEHPTNCACAPAAQRTPRGVDILSNLPARSNRI